MILYDRNAVFLGMGSQELYLLGYEDMEEFKNYHNDFADLFINKPGYIFKFQNFSWIDYTLHSGTPNRKVLIKTKNGKEIETSLNIHEIFLRKELSGSHACFCIELSNAPFRNELPISSKPSSAFDSTERMPESFSPQIEIDSKDALPKHITTDSSEESSIYDTDYTPSLIHEEEEKHENDFQITSNDTPVLEPKIDIKLRFDDDILSPKPQTYSSIDEIKIDDLDFPVSQEHYHDDKYEDLQNDNNLFVHDIKTENRDIAAYEDFDFSVIADELGLDISLLAQILSEYIEELDEKMPTIKAAIEQHNFILAKNEISKLKSVAYHLRILHLCNQFDSFEKILENESMQESVNAFLNLNQTILKFKSEIQ